AMQVLRDLEVELIFPVAALVEIRLPAVRHVDHRDEQVLGQRPLRGPLLLDAKRPAPDQEHQDRHERDALHASNHIRADSRTMPRSIARATWASCRLVSAGTSSLSASWRSTSISRRMARIRSPSCPPNDSSTIPLQSSSPAAQRKTDGMNPA